MARVDDTRLLPLERVGATGLQLQNFQAVRVGYLRLRWSWFLRQWVRMDRHCGVIKTCLWQLWKFGYLPKHFCFLTNGALIPIVGGRDHWWWLWNTQRDKTHCFISRTKAYKHKKLNTRPLSFSLVFLSNLSTQNNISLACYLYTNSKQDISTFKCEGGWRHTAGGWRWQLVAASGGCLPWPSRWIEFNTTFSSPFTTKTMLGLATKQVHKTMVFINLRL